MESRGMKRQGMHEKRGMKREGMHAEVVMADENQGGGLCTIHTYTHTQYKVHIQHTSASTT